MNLSSAVGPYLLPTYARRGHSDDLRASSPLPPGDACPLPWPARGPRTARADAVNQRAMPYV